jgi:hypothetical protein
MAATAPTSPSSPSPAPGGTGGKPGGKPGGGGSAGGLQVPRPNGVCAVSGRPIAPGERFMAAVRETPTGLERLDVAAEHWEAFDREHKTDLLGFWQAVMPQPEQKKKVFVDDEVLCTLFERLAEAAEPAKVAFRFVLGLILMRKRLVIYESTRHEPPPEGSAEGAVGRDVWVVRMKGREDRLDLVDPKLDEKQVMEVSQQLGEILNEEW